MIRFHDALIAACDFASDHLSQYDAITVIRDPIGRVSLAINCPEGEIPDREALSRELHERLGRYSPGEDQAVQSRDDLLFPDEVFQTKDIIRLQNKPVSINLVDRLISNQDWLRRTITVAPSIATAVAYSIKGGVGRSTAFAAWAHHLVRLGKKVLVVDLDLEAPGIQSLLLADDESAQPEFGMIDWLTESRVGQADAALFRDMTAAAALKPGTPGRIDVIPASGRQSRDYVAKLGRAYLPAIDENGEERGFAEAVHALLAMAALQAEPYDLVLLDARAGMHDIGAACITRLGAQAFLFARDDAQTWKAYGQLFDHLKSSPNIEWGMLDDDLRWRLTMVGAQAKTDEGALAQLRARSYDVWGRLYDQEDSPQPDSPAPDDKSMPHWPVPIYKLSELEGSSFSMPGSMPDDAVLERGFRDFFDVADARMAFQTDTGDDEEA